VSFRIVDERVAHEAARGVRLTRVTVEAGEGERFERDVLRHPGSVAVVPVLPDGRAVLVRQYRAAVDEHVLEIPAGLRDVPGEPPETTGRRELEEEIGYRVTGDLVPLTAFWNAVGLSDEVCHVFLATELEPCDLDRQGLEELAMGIEHVALPDVPDLVASGRIRDSKTIIGLLLARQRLG
jgi:8-oxo-dGTP pyrophosphatase MutT (NUDIX family)